MIDDLKIFSNPPQLLTSNCSKFSNCPEGGITFFSLEHLYVQPKFQYFEELVANSRLSNLMSTKLLNFINVLECPAHSLPLEKIYVKELYVTLRFLRLINFWRKPDGNLSDLS
jgi:hypothetical protein